LRAIKPKGLNMKTNIAKVTSNQNSKLDQKAGWSSRTGKVERASPELEKGRYFM
jgi:hypothetical protein